MITIRIFGLMVDNNFRKLYREELRDLAARFLRIIRVGGFYADPKITGQSIVLSNVKRPMNGKQNPLDEEERKFLAKMIKAHIVKYLPALNADVRSK